MSFLLQEEETKVVPFSHFPFHLFGIGDIPLSYKLSLSGQIPSSIIPMITSLPKEEAGHIPLFGFRPRNWWSCQRTPVVLHCELGACRFQIAKMVSYWCWIHEWREPTKRAINLHGIEDNDVSVDQWHDSWVENVVGFCKLSMWMMYVTMSCILHILERHY